MHLMFHWQTVPRWIIHVIHVATELAVDSVSDVAVQVYVGSELDEVHAHEAQMKTELPRDLRARLVEL